jgi:hypothetical protein
MEGFQAAKGKGLSMWWVDDMSGNDAGLFMKKRREKRCHLEIVGTSSHQVACTVANISLTRRHEGT